MRSERGKKVTGSEGKTKECERKVRREMKVKVRKKCGESEKGNERKIEKEK